MNKYTIEVDEKQLRVINEALDMYSRMGTGQLDVAVTEFIRMNFWETLKKASGSTNINTYIHAFIENNVTAIKERVWNHSAYSSYSIFNQEVPQKCREAYDLKQVFRKAIAEKQIEKHLKENNREAANYVKMTVNMNSYFPTNPDWPKAKISIKEDSDHE